MKSEDWENLTALIDKLDEYKNQAFKVFDQIINSSTPQEQQQIIVQIFFEPTTIAQTADKMKNDLSNHIQDLKDYYEIILQDVAKNLYSYTLPIIQKAIEQSIMNLNIIINNNINKLRVALKILRQQKINADAKLN